MPVPLSYGVARGGPLPGTSSYFGGGEGFAVGSFPLNGAQTVSVNGTSERTIWAVPGVSPLAADGFVTDSANPGGGLLATNAIGNIVQIRLATSAAALAASTANLTLSFFIWRGGAALGGGAFAGWASASNAAIAAFSQITVPFLVSNTALIDPTTGAAATVATRAILPVVPGDVITLSVVTGAAVNVPVLHGWLDIV